MPIDKPNNLTPTDNSAPWPYVHRFESATIVLPVINEVVSLQKTAQIILSNVKREDLKEIQIVVSERTSETSRSMIGHLQSELGTFVVVIEQRLPFLGGALREAFRLARGTHVIMMSSDLETDPVYVPQLIEEARKRPFSIVSTSRWLPGGAFRGYTSTKLVCNWIFQRFLAVLFCTSLSDLTFGFRIFPTALVQAFIWEEVRHPFCLECILKPLRLGVPIHEIPCIWQARIEGESQNPFLQNFRYFLTAFRVRFASKATFLKSSTGHACAC
jgi:hypothetical protein